MPAAATCACGNAATTTCDACRQDVCALCVRRDGPSAVCIRCRTGAIKRAELQDLERAHAPGARKPAAAGLRVRARRLRKRFVFVPATVTVILAAVAAVAVPLLDAAGARRERRAHDALAAIAEGEERYRRSRAEATYTTLGELQALGLVQPVEIHGYELRVDLSHDRKAFWARAIARDGSVRSMAVDGRGRVFFDVEDAPPRLPPPPGAPRNP